MKQPKKNYSAPSADLLVVRFEQNILTGSDTASAPSALPTFTNDYEDWD